MPTVSIILPTYNRAKFLPQAFESIRAQEWTDWELIVVDDGSTDNTRELVAELTRGWQQPVRYVYQENQGAYAARNTGLDLAAGKYIAFLDSDDAWLAHHLRECVEALDANADLDWVFSPCRQIEYTTGRVVVANTFYKDGIAEAVLRLKSRRSGTVNILVDPDTAAVALRCGLRSGPQTSVYRRAVFAALAFPPFPPVEDQIFTILALKSGFVPGYVNSIHVNYYIHRDNISCPGGPASSDKVLRVAHALVTAYEWLGRQTSFDRTEMGAYKSRLGKEYFWHLAYNGHWALGEYGQALAGFAQALRLWPWDWRMWKTYSACRLKVALGLCRAAAC